MWFFRNGLFYVPDFYYTLLKIIREKPDQVIIQLPQGLLLFCLVIIKSFVKIKIIADVHTGFLFRHNLKSTLINRPFRNFLKYCDLILVHNQEIRQLLPNGIESRTMVVYDPWYVFNKNFVNTKTVEKYMVIPCSFRDDEPIEEILECITESNIDLKFYITGNWREKPSIVRYSRENIIFTGFISQSRYEELISNSVGIIAGTRDEYTSMMSAWEAVAYKKPLVLSETITLRNLYKNYPLYFNYHDRQDFSKKILMSLNSTFNENEWNNLYRTTKQRIENLECYLNKN